MTGIANLEQTIQKLEQATSDARAVTREVHSAIKDLKQAQRQAEETYQQLEASLAALVQTEIKEFLGSEIGRAGEAFSGALQKALRDVHLAIDQQVNLCLYGNTQGKGVNIFDELRAKALYVKGVVP